MHPFRFRRSPSRGCSGVAVPVAQRTAGGPVVLRETGVLWLAVVDGPLVSPRTGVLTVEAAIEEGTTRYRLF